MQLSFIFQLTKGFLTVKGRGFPGEAGYVMVVPGTWCYFNDNNV